MEIIIRQQDVKFTRVGDNIQPSRPSKDQYNLLIDSCCTKIKKSSNLYKIFTFDALLWSITDCSEHLISSALIHMAETGSLMIVVDEHLAEAVRGY